MHNAYIKKDENTRCAIRVFYSQTLITIVNFKIKPEFIAESNYVSFYEGGARNIL